MAILIFIISKKDHTKAITIFREFRFSEVKKYEYYPPDEFRHYKRLIRENNIAAIEIYNDLLSKKNTNEFNCSLVDKDSHVINGVNVLSYANKLNLSIIANQINNTGFYYKTMALRNVYHVLFIIKKHKCKKKC